MRPTQRAILAVFCLLWLACAAQAQGATASPVETEHEGETTAATESARSHFRLGVGFYRERNFRAALIEFQRAYADAPHYKLLYNLGQASLELQEYASAIDFLNAYLRQGGNEITAERRTEVEESIHFLESRIAHVSIVSNRAGAELYVDSTLVGTMPMSAPVRVGAGRHKFTATIAGFATVERQLDVAAGDERELRLDFVASGFAEPKASAAPERAYERNAATPSESSNAAPIALAVTTGVLAAGAVTLTIVTGIAQQDYQEELLVETSRSELDSLRKDAEAKALVTDLLWGATLVSAVVTTVLLLTNEDGMGDAGAARAARAARAAHSGARSVQSMNVSMGPSGIAVDGRF